MNSSDREAVLRRRLERVRRRLADDVPHSPDWAAAMAELEEVETALAVVVESATADPASRLRLGSLSPSADA
jgi:hypothetical protein